MGKRIHAGGDLLQIVGLVEDGKYESLGETRTPAIFRSLSQAYNPDTYVVARSWIASDRALREVEQAVQDLDSSVVFIEAGSLYDHVRLPLFPARLTASVLGSFGNLAILLAIYGVVAYSVSRCTREIGIRIAIGATRGHVFIVVLRRTALLLSLGSVLGVLAAAVCGRLVLTDPLWRESEGSGHIRRRRCADDCGNLRCQLGPARRAMALDPLTALRQE